ncbi:trypsin inhibitor DE-3-like [Neltuma alba]|uniref:trypsin inhibitor DE-3-like n=1 Tax=Neltuma alba TaxID=207710 RepID=UPI0010A34203|nr:trypsin inhibitor DE-3-like [Prosopis alba]
MRGASNLKTIYIVKNNVLKVGLNIESKRPAIHGGGLGLAATRNETCPLTGVQIPFETTDGLAVMISSPTRLAYIAEGLLLNMAFTAVPPCATTPSKWTIIEEDPAGKSVKISGYAKTVDGKFKMIKYQSLFYKLKFCPSSDDPCGNLGLYYDETGNRRTSRNCDR